jgi:phosphoglycolate phosphatase
MRATTLMQPGARLVPTDSSSSVDAVLFDLDGTLVHTAPCIAAALNEALAVRGLGAMNPAVVTTMIGGGVPALIERALTKLGVKQESWLIESVLADYRKFYLRDPGLMPLPFAGVERALAELRRMGLKLGVVTNTFDRFVREILRHAGLLQMFDIVVSADTLPERKPHPAPLLYACRSLAVEPQHALLVGDSRNDAEAAQAAHMRMVCMTYGYNEGNSVAELPCLAFLADMAELPPLLQVWRRADAAIAKRAASD